jgi:hypothetical protein
MREVLDHAFPNLFEVTIGTESPYAAVTVNLVGQDERLLAWWDESDIVPGFIGGNYPNMGQFGYWWLFVIQSRIAWKLNAHIYDDGFGEYSLHRSSRGADLSFTEHILMEEGGRGWWLSMKTSERRHVPEVLLPYFDGKQIPAADNSAYSPPDIESDPEEPDFAAVQLNGYIP